MVGSCRWIEGKVVKMISYIVLLAVGLAFLVLCRICFYRPVRKSRAPYVPRYERRSGGERMALAADKKVAMDTAVTKEVAVSKPVAAKETEITKEIVRVTPAVAAMVGEETRVLNPEELRDMTREVETSTMTQPVLAVDAEASAKEVADSVADVEALLADTQSLLRQHVRHFLVQYATVTPDVVHDVEVVTERCFAKLGERTDAEIRDMLGHIMVQEALANAQRVYVMMPDQVMLEMVAGAFAQVALGERHETMTLLAYDALAAWTHMDHAHFRVLGLLLMCHYFRNTNNTSASAFRRYTKKYIEPLVKGLPTEYSYYQQLEYLHCISLRESDLPFTEVLCESYPYFFCYEGFTRTELMDVLGTLPWKAECTVHSIYGDYYKFPIADANGLPDLFAQAGIETEPVREGLTRLMQKRPIHPARHEMVSLLRMISPVLSDTADMWDGSMLRRSAPTLLGMYIGHAYIKEVIGEEFDLSRWI